MGTTGPTAWSRTELGLPLLLCVPLSQAGTQGKKKKNPWGNSSSSNLFCWDPVSNGAPGCPKAWFGLISLLLINKELFRAISS